MTLDGVTDVPDPSPTFVSQVVLIHAGLTSLIAHIRVGLMQVALEAKSAVQPAVGRSFFCPDTSAGCRLWVYSGFLPVQLTLVC